MRIRCYLRQGGDWRFVKTRDRRQQDGHAVLRQVLAAEQGPWKLVASYKATAKYAATTSGAEYLRVK